MNSVDDTDKAILEQYFIDAARSLDEIAERIGESPERVEDGVERLQGRGLMGSEMAVVNPRRVGYPVISYHLINLQNNYDLAIRAGLDNFERWPGGQLAMVVLGKYDVIARKVSKSAEELDIFATNVLSDPDTGAEHDYGPLTNQLYNIETFKISQLIRWRGNDIIEEHQRDVPEMDLSDEQQTVLEKLQKDGTYRDDPGELAANTGTHVDGVEALVAELEGKGAIMNYSVQVDTDIGSLYRAFFAVSTERGEFDSVVSDIQDESSFHVPFIGSGFGHRWADIVMEIVFDSVGELDTITDRIRSLDGVQSSRTFFGTRCEHFDETVPTS